MGKFRQMFTELSTQDTPIVSFPEDNLSKEQGILTKLAICIDIKEVWFGIANGQKFVIFFLIYFPLSEVLSPKKYNCACNILLSRNAS